MKKLLKSNFRFVSTFAIALCMLLSLVMFSSPAYAAVSEEQAMKNLTIHVYSQMQNESYQLENGGSITGKDLFTGSATKGYDLVESEFVKLSRKGQESVVSDIATYSNAAIESDSVRGVDSSTVELWWKQLQTKQGVGSKFMTEILKNTKPDFVTANRIYEPFAGPIGIALGFGSIVIMGVLGVVMLGDIAYITLPPFRMLVGDKDKGGKKSSLFITHDAILAVEMSENSSGGDGEPKQALGIYFKRRVFMLILLGICLMYLISGNIYTLVGYILDLVSGFIGF